MDRKHMSGKGKGTSKGQKTVRQNEKYKKYIGNRSEGQGFADKRKRKIQYEYMKMLKKEKLREKLRQATASHKSELQQATTSHKAELHKSCTNQNASKTSEQIRGKQDMEYKGEHKGPAGNPCNQPGTRKKRPVDNEIEQLGSRPSPEKKFKGSPTERHQNMVRKGGNIGKEGTSRFSKAAQQHRQRKEKTLQKQQEYVETKKKNVEAMGAYQKRKQETFKKICKKTHKGQPVMKNQIEYLLQKIERQVNPR